MSYTRFKKAGQFTLNTPVVESIEPRVLYSADPLAALVSDVLSDPADQQLLLDANLIHDLLLPQTTAAETTATALYVVDKAVNDYEHLIDSLELEDSDVLLVIDSNSGLAEISAVLTEHTGLSELHFFTHSEGAGLRLGGDVLDVDSIGANEELFLQWADALSEDADILLYGCNLAATAEGVAFVDLLSVLTGADIAASTNLTGAADHNADWVLEHKSGEIETDIEEATRSLSNWNGILANIVVTTGLDVVDGDTSSVSSLLGNQGDDGLISLREAIIAANNTAGAESITLNAPGDLYSLSIATDPVVGDEWETGDFDISGDLVIRGDIFGTSTISGGMLDRVFEIQSGDVEFHDVVITEGFHAFDAGTGISVVAGNLDLFDVQVTGNSSASSVGGGIFLANGTTLEASDTTISDNSATLGGGVFVEVGASASIYGSNINSNFSSGDGGAIFTNGQLDVSTSRLEMNNAFSAGGAIYAGSTSHVTIFDVDFHLNTAESGGAISNLGETVIEGGYFTENKAELAGVAVHTGNIGGAIFTNNDLIVENSTFDRNTAMNGAGIYSDTLSTATVNNATFVDNEAFGQGGGLFVVGGSVTVTHATIIENSAVNGGPDLYTTPDSLTISSSVFSENDDRGVSLPTGLNYSAGYNVADFLSEVHLTDITGANLNFGTLQDNGGLVPTIALLPGSDAIDAGLAGPRFDATGQLSNEIADAGAFEYQQTGEHFKVYWTDSANNTIYRANSTGGPNPTLSAVQAIAQTEYSPWDIEYDAVNERIIWTENDGNSFGRIVQSDLGGQSQIVLAETGAGVPFLMAPRGLALDIDGGFLYVINDVGSSGLQNGVLRFQLNASSIVYDAAILQPVTSDLGFINAQDIEFVNDSDLSDDWLFWSDTTFAATQARVILLNTTTNNIYSTFTGQPEASGLSWNEANNTLHLATDDGVVRTEWDLSGPVPQVSTLDFIAQSVVLSGIHYEPLNNNVIATSLGSSTADGEIRAFSEDYAVSNFALAGVSTPYYITTVSLGAVPGVPVLQTNNVLALNEGTGTPIQSFILGVLDPDTAASAIEYTLESDLFNGVLELAGVAIGVGQTFTQQDIDSGLLRYVHDDSETTEDYFLFSVSDGSHVLEGLRFNIDILPVNDHVPIASNGFITVAEDQFANTAEDASGLVFGNLAGISEDADVGDTLSYSLVSSSLFGVTIINPDGTFSYDFTEVFESGSDSFEFAVTDSFGQAAFGTVSITILPVNDSMPQANLDNIVVAEAGMATTLVGGAASLIDNDTDADLPNDNLTVVVPPSGVLSTINGSVILNADGTFSYTHDGSETSNDFFNYTIVDDEGRTSNSVVLITINPVSENPPVLQNQNIQVAEGAVAMNFVDGSTDLLGTLTDVDVGDTHFVHSLPINGPANGDVIFNADNTFSYTHDDSETTSDQFVYRVEDSGGNTTDVTVDVVINPINDNVPVVPDKIIQVDEGGIATTFQSGDVDLLSGLVDSDAGDTHTIQLITQGLNGVAVLNADNTFSYTHDDSETTSDQFVYRVEDSGGNTTDVTVDVVINPINDNVPVVPDKTIVIDEGDIATAFQSGDVDLLSGLVDADAGDTHTIQLITQGLNGVAVLNADNTFSYTHDDSETTSDQFVYRVEDSGGNTTDVTVDVVINPINDNVPVVPDKTIVIDEGDIASAFQSGDVDLLSGLVDGDAGDTHTVQLITQGLNGVAVLNADNTFSYTHDDSETTSDQFVYRVTDSGGNTTDVTVDVLINPTNDNVPVVPDKTIVIDEGDIATAFQSGSTDLLSGLADDDLTDAHTIQLVAAPVNGAVVFNADNTFSYTHDDSETTSDQFVYRVTDSGGNSTDVAVNVLIVPVNENTPIVPNDSITLAEGGFANIFDSGRIGLLDNIFDADVGDSAVVQAVAVTDPVNGSVVFNPDNSFSYIHDGGETLNDQFVYRVEDAQGNTTDVTVDINVLPVNDAPAGTDNTIQTTEDTPLVLMPGDFGFSDVADGDGFSGIVLSAQPTSGSLLQSGQPLATGSIISITSIANGDLLYVPDADVNGQGLAAIGFRVMDSGGTANGGIDTDATANTLDIDILPSNDSPFSADVIPDLSVAEGQMLQFQIPVSAFGDVDGDSLQLSITQLDGSAIPPWLTLDPSTGVLDVAPGFVDNGDYEFMVTATDPAGATASQVFALEVLNINQAPTGLLPLEAAVDENSDELAIASLVGVDPDADDTHSYAVNDPRFTVVDGQLWLTSGSALNFELENQVGLVITVTDSSGASTEVPFIVNVNDVNEVPQVQADLQAELGAAPFDVELPDNLFVDEDGDLLDISATLENGSPLPLWIIFDPVEGTLTVAEDAPADTQIRVLIIADDGNGGTTSTVIQLTVEPEIAAAEPDPIVEIEPQTALPEVDAVIAEIDQPEAEPEVSEGEVADEDMELVDSEPEIAAVELEPETGLATIAEVLNAFERDFVPSSVEQNINEFRNSSDRDDSREENSGAKSSEFSSITDAVPLTRLMTNTSALVMSPLHKNLANKLDLQREELKEYQISVERVTQTTVSVGTGISVGYIVWLLRSGVVLGSMLSALPAWRSIDPLPILGSLENMDDEDEESLESMVEDGENETDGAPQGIIRRVFKRP